MKLKNKVLFSFLCISMMLFLFAFVDVCAEYADKFVEKRAASEIKEEERSSLEYSVAAAVADADCRISQTGSTYTAKTSSAEISDTDLARLISQIEYDGMSIVFDGIEYFGTVTFTKNVSISGALSLTYGNLTVLSERLTVDGAELLLLSGSAVIKNGSVHMASGCVTAEAAPAFVLSYSASSSLFVSGGEVCGKSTEGAIVCTMGSVFISGGSILGEFGCAVKNSGTLVLSGTPEIAGFEFDVRTENPITLSGAGGYFETDIKVLYGAVFEKGSTTQVFRGCNSDSYRYIDMYDAAAESVTLTYFESSEDMDEENFLAVYLPYAAKFYSSGSLYHTEYFLKNEAISAPAAPSVTGYDFGGWYTDQTKETPYIFGTPGNADFSLFAGFSLTAPEFMLNSMSFTYDGTERTLSFDSFSHPLMDFGSFSFEWYKNSEVIMYSSESVPICSVSDSGAYKCKLTFSYNGDFVSVITPEVAVNIEKAVVEKPGIPSCEYTGREIFPSLPSSELYTSDLSPSVNVGSYPVTFTLADFVNYKWSDSETKFTSSFYEITRAENEFLTAVSVKDAFLGDNPAVSAAVKFGEIKILYSEDGGHYSESLPEGIGEYFLKVAVLGTDNYSALESEPIAFRILEELPVGIKLDSPPDKTEYLAFERLDLSGARFSVTYNSGRVETADNASLEIRYRMGDCFHAEDSCAVVYFGGVSVPVTVGIGLAEYDISGIVFDDMFTVYNGRRQSIAVSGEIVGLDGLPLTLKVTGGGIDAGQYTVTLTFETDSLNYRIPSPIARTLTISPYEAAVSFEQLSFVYDGTPKIPVARALGAEGAVLPITVSGAGTDAGIYTAYASVSDPNYRLCDAEAEFEILKADLDFSGIIWSSESFVYDGGLHSVTVSGLPSNVSLVGYTDSTFTEAGEYTATAAIVYDVRNYNVPAPLTHSWRILTADYDFSDCLFLDSEYIFDGCLHYPRMVGNIPVGADGSSPSFSYSRGVTHVFEGRVKITVAFSVSSKNYNTPQSLELYVKINPKPINVLWGELNFVYNAEPHIPTAHSDECEISVAGSATDAGEYTAVATAVNSDYAVNNSEVTFIIARAANFWVNEPSVSRIFEGRTPSPYAAAHSGDVLYAYYTDRELTNRINPPSAPGKYYMLAYVPESLNYNYLAYAPIEFEVMPILPLSLSVEIDKSALVAMRALTDEDISAYLCNNDGSKTYLSVSELSVEYEAGTVLLAKDRRIGFSYGDFNVSYDISVAKASYDMSGAHWTGTSHVYSGEECTAALRGLPEGVYVIEYIKNSAINAGEYELLASLGYDSDNYLEPKAPPCTLKVEKCPIEIPKIPSFTYDGTLKSVSIPEGAVYKTAFTGASDAGSYEVVFTLCDPENYCFAGSASATLEIAKRGITLEVLESGDRSTVVSGSICGSDILGEEYYTEDGYVYVRISNPNYDLTVIPAQQRDGGLMWTVMLLSLLFVLLILGAVIVYRRRAALAALISGAGKGKESSVKKTESSEKSEELPMCEPMAEPPLETLMAVDEEHANSLISDSVAKNLVTDVPISVETEGRKKAIVNIDTISESFLAGDTVDINSLKDKKLVARDAGSVKVLARGVIDKPLTVIANSFSLSAVKMIALTGGSAKRAHTVKRRGAAESE